MKYLQTEYPWVLCICLVFFLCTLPVGLANEKKLYIECPCTLTSNGEGEVDLSLGIKSFSTIEEGSLRVQVRVSRNRSVQPSGTLFSTFDLPVTVSSGGQVANATYTGSISPNVANLESRLHYFLLLLYNAGGSLQDRVLMADAVQPSEAFDIGELNFLTDSDDDGVGDVSERRLGTDPADPSSTPADPIIDVLAIYSAKYQSATFEEPITRIRHQFELANQMLVDSQLNFKFRLVGMQQMDVDDTNTNVRNVTELAAEVKRHGADLTVVFGGGSASEVGYCGLAPLFGIGLRGYLPNYGYLRRLGGYARVVGRCGARTLTHELGHIMGLGHSLWQNSVGAWRWSRGYGITSDFYTIMSYGQGGRNINVFSSPSLDCTALGAEMATACGAHHHETHAADSLASLTASRFQYADLREGFVDTDGDNFVDPVDDLPNDPNDYLDTDGDGIGNSVDPDDDGDGFEDSKDAFPLDNTEWLDTDGDGVGDNTDVFPEDPNETVDSDGDGVGDNGDAFPTDPTESADSDGDGVGDNKDAFPQDPDETLDSDGDGIGNNADSDDDNDGQIDTQDFLPLDPSRSQPRSYKFVGSQAGERLSTLHAFLDADNGVSYFVIGAPDMKIGDEQTGAVYLINRSDLEELDRLDGDPDRVIDLSNVPNVRQSWILRGEHVGAAAGDGLDAGDFDGDGKAELVVGSSAFRLTDESNEETSQGAIYIIALDDLATLDQADNTSDQQIALANINQGNGSWKIIGAHLDDLASSDSITVADVDQDDLADLLLGAPGHRVQRSDDVYEKTGGVYLQLGKDLVGADAADDSADQIVYLEVAVAADMTYLLRGQSAEWQTGVSVSMNGDFDGDGKHDLMIGSRHSTRNFGRVYLVSSQTLFDWVQASEPSSYVLELTQLATQPNVWLLESESGKRPFGSYVRLTRDFTGDSKDDLLVGSSMVFLIDGAALQNLDTLDGVADQSIRIGAWTEQPDSVRVFPCCWSANPALSTAPPNSGIVDILGGRRTANSRPSLIGLNSSQIFRTQPTRTEDSIELVIPDATNSVFISPSNWSDRIATGMAFVADLDGDDAEEILVSAPLDDSNGVDSGSVFLVYSSDLEVLLSAENSSLRSVMVQDLFGNQDADDSFNFADPDDDNDGIHDRLDLFALDPTEWSDRDRDGVGDNRDAFPDDAQEQYDTDGDGLGDNLADDDDDNDGILDVDDKYPLDTDNDGLMNSVDPDDDGDQVLDSEDKFPLDPTEWVDFDNDGIGDNADLDDDNDGVQDEDDAFPFDPTEQLDTDGDGVGDNTDLFPTDSTEWVDFDNDGIGDNADLDDDNDGVPDLEDDFPYDPQRSKDSDMDGYADPEDAFPHDPTEWSDVDGDGIGDNSDTDNDNDGVEDQYDLFPRDASRYEVFSFGFAAVDDAATIGGVIGFAGDVDRDGLPEVLVAGTEAASKPVAYLLSGTDWLTADRADSLRDGSIKDNNIQSQLKSWKFTLPDTYTNISGFARLGDIGGDGADEFLIVARAGNLLTDAYVISAPGLWSSDAKDRVSDHRIDLDLMNWERGSWKIIGDWNTRFGFAAAPFGDIDGDGLDDFVVSAPDRGAGERGGVVYIFAGSKMLGLDLEDTGDGRIRPANNTEGDSTYIWEFRAENTNNGAGYDLAVTDFDEDQRDDLVVSAIFHKQRASNEGRVYLISNADFDAIDRADGVKDLIAGLSNVAEQSQSYVISGGFTNAHLGIQVAAADLDKDTTTDFVMSSWEHEVFVVAKSDLDAIDSSDGEKDSILNIQHIDKGSDSYKLQTRPYLNPSFEVLTGISQESSDFLCIGSQSGVNNPNAVVLLSRQDFAQADALDGETDGTIDIRKFDELPLTWRFRASNEKGSRKIGTCTSAGDFDRDGFNEFLLNVTYASGAKPDAFVLSYMDLAVLDAMDGEQDQSIDLELITNRGRYSRPPN